MVDALREARRVVRPNGILIDVRPVAAPLVIEVVIDNRTHWAIRVDSSVGADDDAAADAAVHHAVSHEWFVFESRQPFDFEIYFDSAEDLKAYAQLHRRMRETQIPYEAVEEQRRKVSDRPARLRYRRSWMQSRYRKL